MCEQTTVRHILNRSYSEMQILFLDNTQSKTEGAE